jgi:hypothetical protein
MYTQRQYRIALQIFQSNRLRRDYADIAAIPQYDKVGEFFFSEMYGPRDFTARDRSAQRLKQFLHYLPGVRLRDVEDVLDLLELTNKLDHELADLMHIRNIGLDFSEEIYEQMYFEADNYEPRYEQIELVYRCLHNVFRLSRNPLIGRALHSTRFLARLAGIEAGYDFLIAGYDALQQVSDIDLFAEAIKEREIRRLDRIYGL